MHDVIVLPEMELEPGHELILRRLWLRGFPCLLLLQAALYFFRLSVVNLLGLAVMVTLLSWCLYQYFLPLHLVRRHALLEHLTSQDSRLRRWLWNGFWAKAWLLFWSLFLALTVLILLSEFSQAQWLLLVASVPLMLCLVPLGLRLTGSESKAPYHFLLALRVAVYLTIAASTIGLIVLHLFGEGVVDNRHLTLLQLVAQSWSGAIETTAIREIGWLMGTEAVINDSVWYLMQQATTLSEQSAALKLAAWIVFLLFVTLQAAAFWFVLAGVLSWVMPNRARHDRLLEGANPGRAFGIGVCTLIVFTYLLTLPGISGFVSAMADRSMRAFAPPAPDACLRQLPQELALVETNSAHAMSTASAALLQQLQARMDSNLDSAFALAVPAVEDYLDWNYSLKGQYAQLVFLGQSVVAAGLGSNSTDNLLQRIEQRLSSHMSAKIDEYVGETLAPRLQLTGTLTQRQFRADAEQFYLRQASYVEELVANSDCLKLELPALSMPDLVHKSAVGIGPVAGLIATRVAARGGAKVLSGNATKRAVNATAAKVAAKATQSAAASGLGLGCGPFAGACMPLLFAATWLGTDLMVNEIDETLNRETLREELLAALEVEKLRIKAEYNTIFETGMSQLLVDFDAHKEQRFQILRDGLGVKS
ncbi:MAG: hypothetical protein Q8L60_03455 [Gammaproteobacteria bacterium]|nr:hypothetical protein [Gammaproteobacteria bacterium]MDP2348839.1 hypothetical protein [Gammaproteobacteria bacterium]